MSERIYELATGAGIFYDEATGLKVLPKKPVRIDLDKAGTRTQAAIQAGHLKEARVETKPTTGGGQGSGSGGQK